MKLRKDFLLAILILFVIPILGYFVLIRAQDDRLKVSASLQPKDSISLNFKINFLSAEGNPKSELLVALPYLLKVIATDNLILEQEQLEHILYIINDRSDLAFMIHENPLKHSAKTRIMSYSYVHNKDDLSLYGDVLLVDAFNRILQIYDRSDPELYKNLLEDISYAFPMVDYRLDKMSKDEQKD